MERDPLNRLREEPTLPPDLETRVVNAVREAGGLRPRRSWKEQARLTAAAVLLLTAGFTGGVLWQRQPVAPSQAPSPQWMLLLANDDTPAADGQSRAAEYGAWMREVADRGVRITGSELAHEGRIVTTSNREGHATPLATIGGYFIVDGLSEADAVALAAASPHVRHGGTVVVKRTMTTR